MLDNIRMAFASLWAGKMRALLTMLGIIIGIGSVIAIVTVGDSLSGSLTDSLQSFGVNNITVSLQQKTESDSGGVRMFAMTQPSEEDRITDAMLEEYTDVYGDSIQSVALESSLGMGTVGSGEDTASVQVTGVNGDYADANGLELLCGRFIKDSDGERQLAVVSDLACETLFGRADASVLGQSFQVTVGQKLLTFYVAGVYEYDDSGYFSMTGEDPVTGMYIPLAAAQKLGETGEGYQDFTVVAAAGTDTAAFLEETEAFFSSFYTRNESWTVTATSMESLIEEMTSMLDTVKLAISAIAAISLLVGGIGVMNIMLVSITERTREIGTRKALGARRGDIRLQFITEAVVICLVGGALGVALGVALGSVGTSLLGYAAKPSLSAILVAVGFSMAIGVFFGYYPANKAAKLDPIDALRYE
ncbi:ABC transporter permease [Candidatus Allofournierella merdipullorum]|uniref:ABC transporter permease n=1 Tax=Candidatus Allofournierella merdipullorum TaxID=2838595 RepID=UPI002A8A046E|nr:ABC transporter permease [Candidatus Fournierella merdipullorum]